jgi:hypothetical protein
MTKNQATLYLTAIGTLLALHLTATAVLAVLIGALLNEATRPDDP